jgi:hypothetical protein
VASTKTFEAGGCPGTGQGGGGVREGDEGLPGSHCIIVSLLPGVGRASNLRAAGQVIGLQEQIDVKRRD